MPKEKTKQSRERMDMKKKKRVKTLETKHILMHNTKSQKRIYNFVIEMCSIHTCTLEKGF